MPEVVEARWIPGLDLAACALVDELAWRSCLLRTRRRSSQPRACFFINMLKRKRCSVDVVLDPYEGLSTAIENIVSYEAFCGSNGTR